MARAWEVKHLDPDDPFGICLKKILRTRVREVFSYAPQRAGTATEEAVHDMRVAARRLKAVLSIFSDRFKNKQLKHYSSGVRTLIQVLGEVRDTDIVLLRLRDFQHAKAGMDDDQALGFVIKHEIRNRRKAERRLLGVLKRLHANDFARDFRRFLKAADPAARAMERSFSETGQRVVTGLLKTFLIHTQKVLSHPRALGLLHAMRIDGKRVRYGMECFVPAYTPEYERGLEEVKALLDLMGSIHDCDVNIPRLRAWRDVLRRKRKRMLRQKLTEAIREFQDQRALLFQQMKETLERWEREGFAAMLACTMHNQATHT
jgi:CHAD domain-containing protein